MDIAVRSIVAEEFEAFRRCQSLAFGWDPDPAWMESGRRVFEPERSLAAFDGTEIAGTTGIFSFELTVPGGACEPAAGVTMVSVKPTHRRRGILTRLMARQLDDIRARGEAIAMLWASESAIYGRFGYGVASEQEALSIRREFAGLRKDLPVPGGRVRIIELEEARAVLPGVHDRARRRTPGAVARSGEWWEARIFRDAPETGGGFGRATYALYEGADGPEGYLTYQRRALALHSDEHGGPVRVLEYFVTSREAYAALWRFVLGLDLVSTLEFGSGTAGEPVLWMLENARRTVRTRTDAVWVRLADIERALAARRYGTEGHLVLDVRDGFKPGFGGRFALEASPAGATCRRTTATANLSLGVAELAQLYMGAGSVDALWRAGRVDGDARALAMADAMFGWHEAPQWQEHF